MLFDPIDNDRVKSDDKDIPFEGFMDLMDVIRQNNCIISVHPHRWKTSALLYVLNDWAFRVIRAIAKVLTHIPFAKRIMSTYYYLAKKI